MPRYRQSSIETEAIRLEYRALIQTPEGAMSAEVGDYLETIRAEGRIYQRIVPAWIFEIIHQELSSSVALNKNTLSEPHDGYLLCKEP